MRRLRVMLVDDHPLYRQGVKMSLQGMGDINVVAEASDGQTAIQLADSLSPDVLVTDINLPGLNGLEAARVIRRRNPNIAVVVLTVYDDEEQLFSAIRVGAAAYTTKEIGTEDLAHLIRRVGRGEYMINDNLLNRPSLATKVLREFRDLEQAESGDAGIFAPLTTREIEILDCVARGQSNKQIAEVLSISDQTVKNHITSILRKLAVNDRTQAVVYALKRGWIRIPNDQSL